uniref:Uncharacterized protein pdi351 n=1 Tax=Pholiota microspora TaxID=1538424 RepID=G3XKU2_PHOMI|nr:hypothetical protein [Pholiota nameko]
MSSPITIRRSSPSSESSTASSSSPTQALYVPVHRRSPSTSTSGLDDVTHQFEAQVTDTHAQRRIYSTEYLLSLRPFAAEGIKEKIIAVCPEAVLPRRVHKRVENSQRSATESTPETTPAPLRRITSRRTRLAGRAPERRKQALGLHNDSWRGLASMQARPLVSV